MACICSLEGLPALPNDVPWGEFTSAMVEAAWGMEFLDLKQPDSRREAERYVCGLAFGDVSELRWVLRESGMHVVFISDLGRDLGPISLPSTLEAVNGAPERLLLWGERQGNGKYYDSRIPRLLSYPEWAPKPKASGRLAIRLRHYELREGDRVTPLFRCMRIVAVEDGDE